MTAQSNMILSSQRAALETAQDVSFQMLDATAKLCELNLQTTRTLIAEATEKLTTTLESRGLQLTDKQGAAALTPSTQNVAAYAKQVYEIATQTNAGIVAALQKHAMMLAPQLGAQALGAAVQGAPGGSDAFVAALTNPFGAAQKAFQQAVDTATAASRPFDSAAA